MSDHNTCPICLYRFDSEARLDEHVPCPETDYSLATPLAEDEG